MKRQMSLFELASIRVKPAKQRNYSQTNERSDSECDDCELEGKVWNDEIETMESQTDSNTILVQEELNSSSEVDDQNQQCTQGNSPDHCDQVAAASDSNDTRKPPIDIASSTLETPRQPTIKFPQRTSILLLTSLQAKTEKLLYLDFIFVVINLINNNL